MSIQKLSCFPCRRNRNRQGRRNSLRVVQRNVKSSSRRPNDSGDAQRVLSKIREELRANAFAIVGNIRNLVEKIVYLSTNLTPRHGRDSWVVIRRELVRALSSVRKVAGDGRIRVQDVLEQVSEFYRSGASPAEKRREIKALSEALEEHIHEIVQKRDNFVGICERVIQLASDCLDPRSKLVYSDQNLRKSLEVARSSARDLVARDISIGVEVNQIMENETAGIVKALFAFVKPLTYRELLATTGRREAPIQVLGLSSTGEVTLKVNMITSFTDAGKFLLDDIGDVQKQYDDYFNQNNLKAYGVIFNLILGLYGCYADALSLFSENCAKVFAT